MRSIRWSSDVQSYAPGDGSGFKTPNPKMCWFCTRAVSRNTFSADATAPRSNHASALNWVCVQPTTNAPFAGGGATTVGGGGVGGGGAAVVGAGVTVLVRVVVGPIGVGLGALVVDPVVLVARVVEPVPD
jgi:hypothetical protein